MTPGIRQLRPSDYWPVVSVIDHWWNGRHMADRLPRLFFEHFTDTSFAAERDGELIGFLVGFVSQSHPAEAYIHFVGVHPEHRGRGLGDSEVDGIPVTSGYDGDSNDRVRFVRHLTP